MTNAVAVKNATDVAVFDENTFDEYAGAGGEEITNRDRKIPLLKVLEPLADNLKKNNSKFIPGAKAGDIVDTAINEVIGTELQFLPVKFKKSFIEWKDKKPVERHPDESILEKCEFRNTDGARKGFFRTDNGNEVSETYEFYGINVANGVWCAISMARGRINAGRSFIGRLERVKLPSGKRAPFFYMIWNMKVIEETKNDDVYHTWSAESVMKLQEHPDASVLFEDAKLFLEALTENRATADYEKEADTSETTLDDDTAF